jgi:hypothetical protein
MVDPSQDHLTYKCMSQKYISDNFIPSEIHVSGIFRIKLKVMNVSKTDFYVRATKLKIITLLTGFSNNFCFIIL